MSDYDPTNWQRMSTVASQFTQLFIAESCKINLSNQISEEAPDTHIAYPSTNNLRALVIINFVSIQGPNIGFRKFTREEDRAEFTASGDGTIFISTIYKPDAVPDYYITYNEYMSTTVDKKTYGLAAALYDAGCISSIDMSDYDPAKWKLWENLLKP
jgi:hypothetical protein